MQQQTDRFWDLCGHLEDVDGGLVDGAHDSAPCVDCVSHGAHHNCGCACIQAARGLILCVWRQLSGALAAADTTGNNETLTAPCVDSGAHGANHYGGHPRIWAARGLILQSQDKFVGVSTAAGVTPYKQQSVRLLTS